MTTFERELIAQCEAPVSQGETSERMEERGFRAS
jgi:hypothetical protein